MLRRLRIEGYKSFRNCELALGPLTVLVGANASGKSNLLDALRLLSRTVTQRSLAVAFEGHRGAPLEAFHRAGRTLEEMLRARELRMAFEADVDISAATVARTTEQVNAQRERPAGGDVIHHKLVRYRVELAQSTSTGRLSIADERLEALRRDATPKASRNAFLEREGDRLHLRREGGGHPFYCEPGLDHTVLSEPLYPPYFPHACAFREELSRWRVHSFEASGMRHGAPLSAVDSPGRTGSALAAFVNRLAAESPEGLARLTERMSRLVPSIEGLQVEADAEGTVQLRLVEHGVPLSTRVASSGTLRVLGLLAAISPATGSTLAACEEPDGSVHARRLPALAETLKEAATSGPLQIIVSTHSTEFARLFDNDALVVCDRDGWETRFLPFEPSYSGLFRQSALEEAVDS